MYRYDERTYLMIASGCSYANSTGIKQDLQKFKIKFQGKKYDYMFTSSNDRILLVKESICSWLGPYFNNATDDIYLFFTGVGRSNGDWVIAPQQKPNKDRFTLKNLISQWSSRKQNSIQPIHLYVFMDSCFSGSWCQQLAQTEYVSSISIFASCGHNEISNEIKEGGLFFQCLIGENKRHLQQKIELLFHLQHPKYINGCQPSNLTPSNIKQLSQNIKNASTIKQQLTKNNKKQPQKQTTTKQEPIKNKLNKQEKINIYEANIRNKKQGEIKMQVQANKQKKPQEQQKSNKKNKDENPQVSDLKQQVRRMRQIIEAAQKRITNLQSDLRKQNKTKQQIQRQEEAQQRIEQAQRIAGKSWARLQKQKHLDLNRKGLYNLPQFVGELTHLTALYLYHNPLNYFPESILKLHNLTQLSIYSAGLQSLPANIGQELPKLKKLKIYCNRLRELPKSMIDLKNLTELYMSVQFDSKFGLSQIPLPPNIKLLTIHLKKKTDKREKQEFEAMCKQRNISLEWYNFDVGESME